MGWMSLLLYRQIKLFWGLVSLRNSWVFFQLAEKFLIKTTSLLSLLLISTLCLSVLLRSAKGDTAPFQKAEIITGSPKGTPSSHSPPPPQIH